MSESASLKLSETGFQIGEETFKQKTTQVVYGSKGQIVKLHMTFRDKKGFMRGMVRCHSDNPAAAQMILVSGSVGKLSAQTQHMLAVALATRRMK